jgi:hypothetical protein
VLVVCAAVQVRHGVGPMVVRQAMRVDEAAGRVVGVRDLGLVARA